VAPTSYLRVLSEVVRHGEVFLTSILRMLRDPAQRAPDEGHHRPTAQHSQQVGDNGQQGHRPCHPPGPESDRDLLRVLYGEEADNPKERQEEDRLNEPHCASALMKAS